MSNAIAVDAAGNAYLAGGIQGTLPVFTAGFDNGCSAGSNNAFLIKVSPGGDQLAFAGCLGAALSYSEATAVAIGSQNSIYIGGETTSTSFVTTAGSFHSTSNSPYLDFVVED